MATGATFEPFSAPGEASDRFARGYSQGASIMERAQRRRWEEEDRSYQQRVRSALEPSMFAKAAADEATANATLTNFARAQQLRQQFGQVAPQAQMEYEEAMKRPTYQEQANALSQLQQKYHWMGLIEEGKPFVEQLNNTRLSTSQFAIADMKLKEAQEMEARKQQHMIERIQTRGTEDRRTAEVTGRGQTNEQKLLRAMEAAQEEGDQEAVQFYQQRLGRLSKERPIAGPAHNLNEFDRLIQERRAQGDEAGAARFEKARDAYSTGLGGNDSASSADAWLGLGPETPAPAAPTAQPAIAPAAPVAAPAKLYVVDPTSNSVRLSPEVERKDAPRAFQQMLEDGLITEEQARQQLEALGFKRRKQE